MAPELQPGPVVVAHPAATVLALLALRSEKAANNGGRSGAEKGREQAPGRVAFKCRADARVAAGQVNQAVVR